MAMRTYLRENWLGVVGLVVGIIGIVASGYTYVASQRYRAPTFVTEPSRTEIVRRADMRQAAITVRRADGREVRSDVTAVRFYFWNDGSEPIRREHILAPLTLRLQSAGSEIIDARILRTSRAVTGVRLQRGPTSDSAALSFAILEPGDGFAGQLIFEGDARSPLLLHGVIEGARLRSEAELAWRRRWHAISGSVGPVTLMALALVALIVEHRLKKSESQRAFAMRGVMLLLSSTFISAAMVLLFYATKDAVASVERPRDVRAVVPPTILPAQ